MKAKKFQGIYVSLKQKEVVTSNGRWDGGTREWMDVQA